MLRRAGKIDDKLPDVDVRTGTLSAKLNDLPGPRRQQVVDQFDGLDPATKRYLSDTDVDAPAAKSADLFRSAGPSGRKALDALSETDDEAADILLEMDDTATQRRFAEAFDEGDVDADELSTALKRYDELDTSRKEAYQRLLATTGDDAPSFVSKLDGETVREFFGRTCRRASLSGGAVPRLDNDRRYTLERPDSLSLADCELSDDVAAEYRRQVVEASQRNSDISAKKVLDQVSDVGSQKRQNRLKRLFASSGEDGIRLVRDLDTETQRKLLDAEDVISNDEFDDWNDWRRVLASYDQRSPVSEDRIKAHIDQVYELGTTDGIDDAGKLLEPVSNLPTRGRLGRQQFLEYDNEIRRTNAYASDPDVGYGDPKTAEVEPDFDGTDKDVDLRTEYRDGTERFIEYKRIDGAVEKNGIIDNVFETNGRDPSSVNIKFKEIGDEVPQTSSARIADINIRYSNSGGISNKEEFKEALATAIEQGRSDGAFDQIYLDKLRVVPENGESFVVDLTKYKRTNPTVKNQVAVSTPTNQQSETALTVVS